ncbi:hypothetical protein C8F04DRAFT_1028892 [Mycena alexandri]|uniref:Uncharacterized protein n=1 Tax=Mycena alexandri TaxID=1745969 RepID=A0AAD6TAN1_9AGAR|nr:hypothetical protein C8F04DRAFT_1219418 [Mycena alexandri]KAJ7043010.1 hypothetical protein C8F04DRAFT_1028892 [Mycena alexandri]
MDLPFGPRHGASRVSRMNISHLLNPLPVRIRRRGKKPVIYLFAPDIIDVSVKLSLIPAWSFSSIYPIVPIETSQSGRESVEWNVRTHLDGSLTEISTGMEVAYLFWEADVNLPPNVDQKYPTPAESCTQFDPASCKLSAANTVLLSTSLAVSYLNTALEMLGLHTEARTSFITFWLPSFLRHKNIALRFLPQLMYGNAAPLDVEPKPDITTRIFVLFTGVADDDLSKWGAAQLRACENPAWWKDVVGIDETQMTDKRLFRVLEWGGMEI